jgi:Zn-dependent protease with chaperone function
MRTTWIIVALLGLTFLFLMTGAARVQEAALKQARRSDEDMFKDVMTRLVNTELLRSSYPAKYAFPPKYLIKPDSAKEMNAYASVHPKLGAEMDPDTRKMRPVALITQGYMREIVKGDEGILAAIMGHELAHLTKGHLEAYLGDTSLVLFAFKRDHEVEADLEGMRFAEAAGFPYKDGIQSAIREMKLQRFTSFENLQGTHPSWEERLSHLDRNRSKLWAASAAYQNGFLFLRLEQYQSAKQCFEAVTKGFPDCPEAWANLGYAQLMHYCDGLESTDLRRYKIGQIVAGAFYARPKGLAPTRGIDDKLWKASVEALNKAVEINPKLSLPHANLGIAYLLHPEGTDAAQADRHFGQALKLLGPDAASHDLADAAVLVNAGVADLALGKKSEALQKFQSAEGISRKALPGSLMTTLQDALLFNQALVAASGNQDDRGRAFTLASTYLGLSSPGSAWYPLAYQLYAKLGKELGREVQPIDRFSRPSPNATLRAVTSVKLADDLVLTLDEPASPALARLGVTNAAGVPIHSKSKIKRLLSVRPDMDVLAGDKILAVFLTGPRSPALTLQGKGLTGKAGTLRVGMTEQEVSKILKGHFLEPVRSVDNPGVTYQFYPYLGVGVRLSGGRVSELVVAQVPMQVSDRGRLLP